MLFLAQSSWLARFLKHFLRVGGNLSAAFAKRNAIMAMVPGEVRRNGTLVVASARDLGELRRFACRTTGYEWLEEAAIATLEPSLAGRFRHGLFFRREAHLAPRRVLCLLRTKLTAQGVTFVGKSPHESFDSVVDCTGAARIGEAEDLRGVRGEMLYLRS